MIHRLTQRLALAMLAVFAGVERIWITDTGDEPPASDR